MISEEQKIQIREAVSQLQFEPDENGLINKFGVYLTTLFGDYYNKISFRFLKELSKEVGGDEELLHAARYLLIEAGHVCGFNTLGGIMKSAEWEAIVQPLIETKEDYIHGVIEVVNVATGWGRWEVVELIPGEKLVVRVFDGFEAEFLKNNREEYGELLSPTSGCCYMTNGVLVALMHLVYVANIENHPELNEDLYLSLFKKNKQFECKETKCISSSGSDYCEFVVERIK